MKGDRLKFWDAAVMAALSGCASTMQYEDMWDIAEKAAAMADTMQWLRDRRVAASRDLRPPEGYIGDKRKKRVKKARARR
jgi:hypothetical protein